MTTWEWPRATVVSHYDGDTFHADVDLGLEIVKRRLPIRLYGINAPEIRPLQEGGIESRDYLVSLIPVGSVVSLTSVGYDKYGPRVDAVVVFNGHSVNDAMVAAGHAVWKDYR